MMTSWGRLNRHSGHETGHETGHHIGTHPRMHPYIVPSFVPNFVPSFEPNIFNVSPAPNSDTLQTVARSPNGLGELFELSI